MFSSPFVLVRARDTILPDGLPQRNYRMLRFCALWRVVSTLQKHARVCTPRQDCWCTAVRFHIDMIYFACFASRSRCCKILVVTFVPQTVIPLRFGSYA